jgi:oligopeptide transport system substrate-binding protein
LVGNGPFTLESLEVGKKILLKRNPDYWGDVFGNVQRIHISFSDDPWSSFDKYQDDQTDVLILVPPLVKDARKTYRDFSDEYLSYPALSTSYLAFNVRTPPFDDARVRRAFALALDKEVIANAIVDGAGFPATGGFVPPGLPAHSEGIGLPYAPDQARKQFSQGWNLSKEEFPSVEGLCPSRAVESLVEYCQRQWKDVLGVDIHWRTVSWPGYLRRLRESPPHIHGLVWVADYPDPDSFLRTSTWRSETGWRNDSYESLVREARSVSDPERRMDMYRQAERVLVQETPIIPFLYGREQYLAKPWLRVAQVLLPGVPPNLEDVIIEPH